jgi:hypothetical protein
VADVASAVNLTPHYEQKEERRAHTHTTYVCVTLHFRWFFVTVSAITSTSLESAYMNANAVTRRT